MNSKERMMTALHKGVPDRLPATVHQWQRYHLKTHMQNLDVVEASKLVGLDCSYLYSEDCGLMWDLKKTGITRLSKNWIIDTKIDHSNGCNKIFSHIIRTPKGKIKFKTTNNNKMTWIVEPFIKHKDDIKLLNYLPINRLNKKEILKAYEYLGDAGILRGLMWGEQGGCWQHACVLYGTEKMIWAAIDDPDWVHEFLKILLDKKLGWIELNMYNARFDLIENGGGDASSTVISPKIFKEFCLPYDRKIHNALHDADQLVVYHTCGGMYGLFDLIISNNTDASETLTPKSQGGNIDGPELYEAMHGKVSLIGGLAQNLIENGTTSEIEKEVYRLFETFGKDGGYICSVCDHFFDTPVENLVAFADTVKNCRY